MSADSQHGAPDRVECVVVGAGVVGLATARALALTGREVLVLEAADAIGTGTSSRNSEVIHAGIYYPHGSLKARLCVAGRQALYRYCEARGIAHRRCGKLIVAAGDAQVAQLQGIVERAARNGVPLRLLTRAEARMLEPALECSAAVLSPDTGIIDSHALMLTLQGDLEHASGLVALNTALERVTCRADGFLLRTQDGTELLAGELVNSAGLSAPQLAARIDGLAAAHVPSTYWCKGNYFVLAGRSPFSRLIYPVPEAAGLGVHLTLDLGGQAKFGPDVQWVPRPDDLQVDAARGAAFYAEVRRYWPALPDDALQPGYAGMRPKLQGPGEPAGDFVIEGPAVHGVRGLVNLFGIESPGLTSALAIGEHVVELLAAA